MNDGGPAFPRTVRENENGWGNYSVGTSNDGMSLRDWYAGEAMKGMLSNPTNDDTDIPTLARKSYQCADAMLKEREKGFER